MIYELTTVTATCVPKIVTYVPKTVTRDGSRDGVMTTTDG
jgi:hypothetical protein